MVLQVFPTVVSLVTARIVQVVTSVSHSYDTAETFGKNRGCKKCVHKVKVHNLLAFGHIWTQNTDAKR